MHNRYVFQHKRPDHNEQALKSINLYIDLVIKIKYKLQITFKKGKLK